MLFRSVKSRAKQWRSRSAQPACGTLLHSVNGRRFLQILVRVRLSAFPQQHTRADHARKLNENQQKIKHKYHSFCCINLSPGTGGRPLPLPQSPARSHARCRAASCSSPAREIVSKIFCFAQIICKIKPFQTRLFRCAAECSCRRRSTNPDSSGQCGSCRTACLSSRCSCERHNIRTEQNHEIREVMLLHR